MSYCLNFILSKCHTVYMSYCLNVILSNAILSICHTVYMPYCLNVILSKCQTNCLYVILSNAILYICHTVYMPYCLYVILSKCQTVYMSYCHIVPVCFRREKMQRHRELHEVWMNRFGPPSTSFNLFSNCMENFNWQ